MGACSLLLFPANPQLRERNAFRAEENHESRERDKFGATSLLLNRIVAPLQASEPDLGPDRLSHTQPTKLLGREGAGEEVADHLDERVGAGLLDLPGSGHSQPVTIVLDHHQRHRDPSRLQQFCQILRVVGRDEPIIGSL